MVSSRNNSSGNSGGSLNLNSLDLSNSWSSNNMMGNRGSYSNNWRSVGNGVNKTVLIDIFRESFQRKGSIAAVCSNKVTNKRSQRA